MSSDPLIFIFVSVLQTIKTRPHSGDVPGGPFWEVSLEIGEYQSSPCSTPPGLPVFPTPGKGHNLDLVSQQRIVAELFSNQQKPINSCPVLHPEFAVSRRD